MEKNAHENTVEWHQRANETKMSSLPKEKTTFLLAPK
jgi:hypothetical protein